MLFAAILSLMISAMALNQIGPSIINEIQVKSSSVGFDRESALIQQIIRYKAAESVYPATIDNLISKNYWRLADNNNGFGSPYTFTVDKSKGIVNIFTTISNDLNRSKYIANSKRTLKPVDLGSGIVSSTFILPDQNVTSSALSSLKSIPVSAFAPSASINTYWYDTSGTEAILKVSDGAKWLIPATDKALAAPKVDNIVASAAALPASAVSGDVRYVYNTQTAALEAKIYYNGQWIQPGSGANPSLIAKLQVSDLNGTVNSSFFQDFKNSLSVIFASTFGAKTIDASKVSWFISGSIPAGLGVNLTTGVISGTPTAKTSLAGTSVNVIATYNGATANQSYLIKVGPELLRVTSVASSNNHTCAITIAGGVKCWGANSQGELGNGTFVASTFPVDVSGLTSGVASIASGQFHSCAVTSMGAAQCWGRGNYGQLGNGGVANTSTPVSVTGLSSGVASIAAGQNHTCITSTAGAVNCWGRNDNGQLGNGGVANSLSPVSVTGLSSGVASIAGGTSHTCAVTTAGAAKCWGWNIYGQLGDGTLVQRNAPVPVSGLASGVASISSGVLHTCAVTTTGAAKCWGANFSGRLGNGTTVNSNIPVDVSGLTSGVAGISNGDSHACAITTAGATKCWGYNVYGQLGNGTTTDSFVPIDVSGLTSGVSKISSGPYYACVVKTTGGVTCWGNNNNGQFGNGTTTDSLTPIVDLALEAW